MRDLAAIFSIVALILVGLGLAIGLMFELDGILSGDKDKTFEAIVVTAAIVALLCMILGD